MSDCTEVIFVSSIDGSLHTGNVYNPHIGTTLMTYRGGGGAARRCLCVLGNDYLISADAKKPILNVWPLNSQEPSHDLRMVIPGRPSALASSNDGHYVVAGINEKIYVWQTSSGSLMSVISKHYQEINKIMFTSDSSHFVTIGTDGLVLVWKLADTVAKQFGDIYKLGMNQPEPIYNFSQHSMPVNDAYIGHGNNKAKLYTVSSDQTCKIFCLHSGVMLLSIIFDYVLTSLTMSVLETEVFVGTNVGKIQVFSIDSYPKNRKSLFFSNDSSSNTFIGHTKAVTCLSSSFDGLTLASGSDDEKVFLWNIPSRQLIHSFDIKGPVSNMFFYFAASNIFSDKFEPSLVVNKFEKESRSENNNFEINVWVRENLKPSLVKTELAVCKADEMSYPTHIENENISCLHQQISTLKGLNKQLYQFAVHKILKNPSVDEFDDDTIK